MFLPDTLTFSVVGSIEVYNYDSCLWLLFTITIAVYDYDSSSQNLTIPVYNYNSSIWLRFQFTIMLPGLVNKLLQGGLFLVILFRNLQFTSEHELSKGQGEGQTIKAKAKPTRPNQQGHRQIPNQQGQGEGQTNKAKAKAKPTRPRLDHKAKVMPPRIAPPTVNY